MSIAIISLAALFGCMSQANNSAATTTTTLPSGPTASVSLTGLAFNPAAITISAGTTVIWTNNDSVTHNVTSTSAPVAFNSGDFGPGGVYSHKFTTVGTYEYQCTIHPNMTGSVTVQ